MTITLSSVRLKLSWTTMMRRLEKSARYMKTQISKFVASNIVQLPRYLLNAIGRWTTILATRKGNWMLYITNTDLSFSLFLKYRNSTNSNYRYMYQMYNFIRIIVFTFPNIACSECHIRYKNQLESNAFLLISLHLA